MLTPEQYVAFQNAVKKFEDYTQNHPEVIEDAARKWTERLLNYKDVALGDKIPFEHEE